MALPNLATTADLSARGVDVSDVAAVDTMLAVASSLVRQAAGSPILQADVTVSWWATEPGVFLDIPVTPVRSVSSVEAGGVAVAGAVLVDGALWQPFTWSHGDPVQVTASLSVGLPEVPADIVQLVCDLAILGLNTAADGARDPSVVAERIDDYSVTFAQGSEAVASAMTVPALTRRGLRARFGRGVGSVRMR